MKEKKVKEHPRGYHLLPKGLTIGDLIEFWDIAKQEYQTPKKRMQVLNEINSGRLWKVINAKLPKYQLKPDVNHVNQIAEDIKGSVYSSGKHAFLSPKSEDDKALADNLNLTMSNVFETVSAKDFMLKAGDAASLFNIGITKVAWDKAIKGGTFGHLYKGDPTLKNINPMRFMRDPYGENLDSGMYTIEWDGYHEKYLKRVSLYKKTIKGYLKQVSSTSPESDYSAAEAFEGTGDERTGYHRVYIYYVRHDEKIYEIHTLNNDFILVSRETDADCFPYSILYCNTPKNDLIGVSEPAKVIASSIVSNVMLSILATHAYKQHRPSKFLDASSGINIRNFAINGNDPDKLWLYKGGQAFDHMIKYQVPENLDPTTGQLPEMLDARIQATSGVNDDYRGLDTGSITTTGGIEGKLSRVTMRDAFKIHNYEVYAKRLTKLIIKNLIKYGGKRSYASKDLYGASSYITLNMKDVNRLTEFNYEISVASDTTTAKAKLSMEADALLEKQMQYQTQPPIITPEEYMRLKDFPQSFKTIVLERLNVNRTNDSAQQVMQALSTFSGLIEQGVDPNQALEMTIQQNAEAQNPQMAGQKLGNTAQPPGGSVQARQQK